MQDPQPDPARIGLARFRSAPATWLDALLEDDDPVKPGTTLTQLLNSVGPGPNPDPIPLARPDEQVFYDGGENTSGFHRMNSLPADFSVDGYFSGFGVSSNSFYFGGGGGGGGGGVGGKRLREVDSLELSSNFVVGQRRGELATANSLVEMEMDKLLEDSVACRVRAKRGCATHPRSIAERVRRTRISDRIRKLQELVPNMDKQTNTSDMLEEAVEYVKTLQKQILDLTEQQKNCKCTPTPKS